MEKCCKLELNTLISVGDISIENDNASYHNKFHQLVISKCGLYLNLE